MGRQSTYTDEAADHICELLSEGTPLREICRMDGMPAWRTVYDWMKADEAFAARIACARGIGFDAIAQDALRIADTPFEGEETTVKPDGSMEIRRGDMLGHRKLQIETRLKLLAKWDPKRYGDKIQQEVTGADGSPLMPPGMTEDTLKDTLRQVLTEV